MEISKYSKSELNDVSKILKKYRTLRKNIGKKSSGIMHYELAGENKILIEYFPSLNKNELLDRAVEAYKKTFGVKVEKEKIIWKENLNLAGGMRLFYGDEMLDLSFENVRNTIRRI